MYKVSHDWFPVRMLFLVLAASRVLMEGLYHLVPCDLGRGSRMVLQWGSSYLPMTLHLEYYRTQTGLSEQTEFFPGSVEMC